MQAVWVVVWLFALLISVVAIFTTVGSHLMVQYFPEGRRWWMFPSQMTSLVMFAFICAFHPF